MVQKKTGIVPQAQAEGLDIPPALHPRAPAKSRRASDFLKDCKMDLSYIEKTLFSRDKYVPKFVNTMTLIALVNMQEGGKKPEVVVYSDMGCYFALGKHYHHYKQLGKGVDILVPPKVDLNQAKNYRKMFADYVVSNVFPQKECVSMACKKLGLTRRGYKKFVIKYGFLITDEFISTHDKGVVMQAAIFFRIPSETSTRNNVLCRLMNAKLIKNYKQLFKVEYYLRTIPYPHSLPLVPASGTHSGIYWTESWDVLEQRLYTPNGVKALAGMARLHDTFLHSDVWVAGQRVFSFFIGYNIARNENYEIEQKVRQDKLDRLYTTWIDTFGAKAMKAAAASDQSVYLLFKNALKEGKI